MEREGEGVREWGKQRWRERGEKVRGEEGEGTSGDEAGHLEGRWGVRARTMCGPSSSAPPPALETGPSAFL